MDTIWAGIRERIRSPLRRGAVHELGEAAEHGDLEQLKALLHPGVAVVVDRGDDAEPTVRVVRGVDDASALLAHGFAPKPGVVLEERPVNSQAGLMLTRRGTPLACVAIDFTGALVSLVWVRLNPPALRRGHTV